MFQPDLLQDKVVLITGGGTGLGRAMAEKFLSLGAKVAIASRREEVLKQAADEMHQHTGGEVYFQSCDVRQPEAVDALLESVIGHFGRIDILVNNAAGNFISPTERLSHRAFDAVLGIVLHGTVYATLSLGKRWIDEGQAGTVLNIVATYASSGAGSGFVVPSAVAKSGVLALTRSLAAEWGRYGIRQVAIAPGPFPTPGAWSRLVPTDDLAEKFANRVPLGRVGNPEELANLAAFLVSDGASYINGEVVTIDGGEWLYGAGEFNTLSEVTGEQWDALAELTRRGK